MQVKHKQRKAKKPLMSNRENFREREREGFVKREIYIMKKQSRCVRRYKQMKNEETSPSTMLNKIIN